MVRQALAEADRHITAAAAEVTVGELPDVDVDATAVGQVLQNLLTNAIKYRREGVMPQLHIEAGWLNPADAPTWWLRVSDNGTGFAPKHACRLFEPFLRLHDKHKYPGAGLGLATSQRLAQGLGGSLRAEGRPNEGASFTLPLPA